MVLRALRGVVDPSEFGTLLGDAWRAKRTLASKISSNGIDELYDRLTRGERLVVQCGGGIGRSGTVACGLLVRAGTPLDEALIIVRANRPMAGPEVGAQADVLADYERSLKG